MASPDKKALEVKRGQKESQDHQANEAVKATEEKKVTKEYPG